MKNIDSKTENREPKPTQIDVIELEKVNGGYESQADQDYRTWYHTQGPGKNN